MAASETSWSVSLRIWINTFVVFTAGFVLGAVILSYSEGHEIFSWLIPAGIGCFIASAIGSAPALIVLSIVLPLIRKLVSRPLHRLYALFFLTLIICMSYGLVYGLIMENPLSGYNTLTDFLQAAGIASGLLFIASSASIFIRLKEIKEYFSFNKNIKTNIMDSNENVSADSSAEFQEKENRKNNVLVKALIVAGLILAMLIPMAFIQNLVTERKERQAETIKEVSSKWAGPQIISNPYLVIPYNAAEPGKPSSTKYLILLPENNSATAALNPEMRKRSIYNVALYRSSINMSGHFNLSRLSKYVQPDKIFFNDIKICTGISEFKAIEDGITIQVNNNTLPMSPGLPVNIIDSAGLSTSVPLSPADMSGMLSYTLDLKIKGSEQLQFVPLSGNSSFALKSTWANPSFTGSQIPAQRDISDNGFTASWKFSQANLPFDFVIRDNNISKKDLAFGVSMVQPVDSYMQTLRCVKYAILIIGLSFAIFFIVELLQKNPVHPVQYALVGLALTIYYTLLLSLSEFTLFNIAYSIAAAATVLLIAYYVRNHFNNLKTGFVFGGFLALLYGFIYVLIQLEDTALLVGSIALFLILAVVMHITRKVNWYKI